ncbi:hypothetical protein KEM52_002920 [Ascosphaera acerosa]|nr:hypothetical protein KEM52_002920 [Ascosphaera acerosa]
MPIASGSAALRDLMATETTSPLSSAAAESELKNALGLSTEVVTLSALADPLLSAFPALTSTSPKAVSVVVPVEVLLHSIPHLYRLATHPIVLHVVLGSEPSDPGYDIISAVRDCGFAFLRSDSAIEAVDLAITAHALASSTNKGVIHFFEECSDEASVDINTEFVRQILTSTRTSSGVQPAPIDVLHADAGRSVIIHGGHHVDQHGLAGDAGPIQSPAAPAVTPEAGSSTPSTAPSNAGDASSIGAPSSTTLSADDILSCVASIWKDISRLTLGARRYTAHDFTGPADAEYAVFLFGKGSTAFRTVLDEANGSDLAKVGLIVPRLFRPFSAQHVTEVLPPNTRRIAVLEQSGLRETVRWGACFLDLLAGLGDASSPAPTNVPALVAYRLSALDVSQKHTVQQAVKGLLQNLVSDSPIQNLRIGPTVAVSSSAVNSQVPAHKPAHENSYTRILKQLFSDRLLVVNDLSDATSGNGVNVSIAARPEYGVGQLLARDQRRLAFAAQVKQAVASGCGLAQSTIALLTKWAVTAEDGSQTAMGKEPNQLGQEIVSALQGEDSPEATALLAAGRDFLTPVSTWLIGSDAWAYDLGNSGVHHVLANNMNVNILLIDSTPYSSQAAGDAHRRKKDVGLYAMNFGNAYVASVAVYSSYTQVLHALSEAEQFAGPSVVVAYLPWLTESQSALEILKETKKAVDIGYWPLYRWDPTPAMKNGQNPPKFTLDSDRARRELETFLKRDNQLTQLARRRPVLADSLAASYGSDVLRVQKRAAKDAYAALLEGLYGAPLTVLYASDSGNAESLAKRLATRGKARGLKTLVMSMDEYPLEDLTTEENVVLITSTAGQGEFPQGGRALWDAIKASGDIDLSSVKYSVFGLGDSEYWPRKEDKIFYNKPGKDLDARLKFLGAKRLAPLGLGDDQDPDGFQTGYSDWEPFIWQALGVDKVEGLPIEPPPKTNEDIKLESNYLRGTIAEGLRDESTMAIAASDQQLTKFHGTYMQDDRDLRESRKAQGLEPAYAFMIRCRLPGGVATPEQWLQMDAISSAYGNETMKLTTRQTFQFHGVIKTKLRSAMQAINRALMTTLAACGDVNRNVMCSSLPELSALHQEVHAVSKRISDHLLPSTTAYHEIWLKDENNKKVQVSGDAIVDHEPLYGPTYLPRKFKVTIAVPPHNDTDVYAHDVGLIAIKGDDGALAGFNVLVGGGMGVTHNNKKTYPRTGSTLGFVGKNQVHIVCEKVMLVQRDHGDRKNRKHARLKYTVDDMGLDVFKAKVEALLPDGVAFEEARPYNFTSNVDTFGWIKDETGLNHFTFFIENGRIEDTSTYRMRTGLRELAQMGKGEFRLTGNQHLILSKITDDDLPAIKAHLAKYNLDNTQFSGLRLSSSACVGFPTCGLAMAESERYLPGLIDKLDTFLETIGLSRDSIVLRVTGCPNGCARPWLAEVGLVGKAYGAYNMYLGGGYHGQRLNKLYRASIKEDEVLDILKSLLQRYVLERLDATAIGGIDGELGRPERFGDWCIRSGIIKPTTEGKTFHDDVAVEDDE